MRVKEAVEGELKVVSKGAPAVSTFVRLKELIRSKGNTCRSLLKGNATRNISIV
jgi:hypothetical protein